jgi:hypothetical protein
MRDLGTTISEQGWLQGSILRDQDLAELQQSSSEQTYRTAQVGVVASHSCDLAHHHPEGEPVAEVLVADIVASQDGNFTYGKHPRRLHLQMNSHLEEPCMLEFLPWRRLWVDRRELAKRVPDKDRFLLKEDVRVLSVWLAQRYQRVALPDDFNSLVQTVSKKRNKLHARISPHVSGLYVHIFPDRNLEEGEVYSMNLLALVPGEQKSEIDAVKQGTDELAELLRQCGIDAESAVRAEDNVSYGVVRRMKRFPLEHLSLRDGNQPFPLDFE